MLFSLLLKSSYGISLRPSWPEAGLSPSARDKGNIIVGTALNIDIGRRIPIVSRFSLPLFEEFPDSRWQQLA
ncbi:hypothetical protein NPIL_42631, partial [Nephila pilipes]